MASYRGMDVPADVCGLLPFMPVVDDCREALLILSQQWDLLDVLSRVIDTGTEVNRTRTDFRALNAALIAAMASESLKKVATSMAAKAQVTVDIVVRNLFERTADIGFLATDDDLRGLLKGDGPSADAIARRLIEYRDKYSVYENVVLMDAAGVPRAQAGQAILPDTCRDPFVQAALSTREAYVETFAPSDLVHGDERALIYSYRVGATSAPESRPLGVLALVFRFADEMAGAFDKLLRTDDWTVLTLLDKDGRVLASSDPAQVATSAVLTVDPAAAHQIVRHAGRRYIAVSRGTKGYQGYFGLGWRGCALVPLDAAFAREDEASALDLSEARYRAIARNARLFAPAIRDIPRRADAIQTELNRTVWNGNLAMPGEGAGDETIGGGRGQASARQTLLSEISGTGSRTRQVFADAAATLNRTAVSAILSDCEFSAALAVDIMDRNLYERANDCRWWALTTSFRQLLANPSPTDADRAEMTRILHHINDLYTVYTNLILFDASGQIQAVSHRDAGDLVGTVLPADLVRRFTARASSAFYGVSDFATTPLYDGRPTYIYGAPVQAMDDSGRIVGGIAIVFDAEPQFRAMLADAGPGGPDPSSPDAARSLFVDAQGRIVASTSAADVVGSQMVLPPDLLQAASGGALHRVWPHDGTLYAIAACRSAGYREFKGPDDAYRNTIYAVCQLKLGPDDAQGGVVNAPPVSVASPTRRIAARARQVATFMLGARWLAFERADVIEATTFDRIAPVPHAARGVAGYAEYDGKSIFVLDPRTLFDPGFAAGAQRYVGADATIVVFRTSDGQRYGLSVDGLGEVLTTDADRAMETGIDHPGDVVKAVTSAGGGDCAPMVLLLDADRLVAALASTRARTSSAVAEPDQAVAPRQRAM